MAGGKRRLSTGCEPGVKKETWYRHGWSGVRQAFSGNEYDYVLCGYGMSLEM
jgi:hypothetical protein